MNQLKKISDAHKKQMDMISQSFTLTEGKKNTLRKNKTYEISIKSHDESPDYEDTCEVPNKEEAAKVFAKRMSRCQSYGEELLCECWSPKEVLPHITEVK